MNCFYCYERYTFDHACVSTVSAACGSVQELDESEGGGGGAENTGRGLHGAQGKAKRKTMEGYFQ